MSNNKECDHCQKYMDRHENYCRMCGFKLADSYARNAEGYCNNEEYCGYCGAKKENCKH